MGRADRHDRERGRCWGGPTTPSGSWPSCQDGQLPKLTEHVVSDVMPLLATLDEVGPDVHELLNQLREVRQAIQGIPGFRLLRRRGEEIEESR